MSTEGQPGALDLYPPSRIGWFAVPRDHFRYDVSASTTFPLKYLVYDCFAAHNATAPVYRAPVLCYCGNEGAVELFYNNSGALFSLASGALRASGHHQRSALVRHVWCKQRPRQVCGAVARGIEGNSH